MPETQWLICDFVTGRVLDELPLSADGGTVSKLVAREETQTLTLAPDPDLDAFPQNWTESLVPGRTMIVLVVDDVPLQAWSYDEPKIGGTTVPLSCTTLETCLRRTNVPDYDTPDADDLALVATTLAWPAVARFGFTITWTPVGAKNEDLQPYSNLEDRTILDALNELTAADPGPEWRIRLGWADATHRAVTKTIEIGKRIGILRPDAIFDLDVDPVTGEVGGCIDTYTRTPSFAAGKGATMVIGTSDGSGSSRPMTDPQVSALVAAGWPVWEERVAFANLPPDEDEDSALLNRARATLKQRERGTVVWEIDGNADAPRAGIDYTEGDSVLIQVAPRPPYDPDGGTTTARVLGWRYNPETGHATPVLWEDDPDGGSS